MDLRTKMLIYYVFKTSLSLETAAVEKRKTAVALQF